MQTALVERKLLKIRPENKPVIPEFTKPKWWDNPGNGRAGVLRSMIKSYLTGTLPKRVNPDLSNHVYYVKNGDLWMFKNNPSLKISRCIVKKVNGAYVGNSSGLTFIRSAPTKRQKRGRVCALGGILKIQEILEDVMPMVPFQMFKDAKLDINSFHLIDKGPSEVLNVTDGGSWRDRNRSHFTGAMVFRMNINPRSREIEGEKEAYYLFDLDRNDLEMKNVNFFLSRLCRPVTSIADAYASLKPKEVADAERFLKQPCQRQGEWFFIPVQGRFKRKTDQTNWRGFVQRGRPRFVEAILQSKGNRPHHVKFISEEGYVIGEVTHGGKEHKAIKLTTWCKPVPNTAVESFKISGAID